MRRLHTNKGFLITSTARLPGGSVGHIHEAGRTTKERQQSAAARCLTTGSTPWRQIPLTIVYTVEHRGGGGMRNTRRGSQLESAQRPSKHAFTMRKVQT